jgi:predicted acetyltransferase
MATHLVFENSSGPLPTDTFGLYDDDQKVGFVQLRHQPHCSSTFPENMKSHVYYEVDEMFQGKGYGNEALRLIKEEAVKIGMKKLWLTAYDSNIPSTAIIVKNGGKPLWDYSNPEGKRLVKYEIDLV